MDTNTIDYDNMNLEPLKPQVSHEDYTALEHDANALAAEPYGGLSVICIGTIMQRRESFKTLTLYATIHYPDPTTGGFTPQQVEGHLKCSSILELATVARSLSVGKTLIVDRKTLEILEVRTY